MPNSYAALGYLYLYMKHITAWLSIFRHNEKPPALKKRTGGTVEKLQLS
jgi:hypothetical protein